MADTAVEITAGTGTNIDTRTEGTNGHHRQVVVLGDPATNAGVAPVDATNGLSVTLTTALPAGTAAIGKLAANSGVDIGDVDVASCALPTGASTSAKQDTGNTSLSNIDGKLPALGQALAAASVPVILPSATITTLTPPAAITGFATSAKQDTIIGHVDGVETLLGTIDADTSALAGAVSGTEMQVDVLTMPTVTANATLSAETTKVIGTVNIAAAQTLATVTAVTAITNALPAGTNAIGKLSANSGVDIGDVDVTSLPALPAGTNAVGKLLPPDIDITTHTNYVKKYYTNAGAVTDGIVWSPAAGKRFHIITMHIQVSAAATVTLEDDKSGGDDPIFKAEYAANSGEFLVYPEHYPLASGEDAADLIVTTSAGNIYISITGYEV
jgi:hypothetical protein